MTLTMRNEDCKNSDEGDDSGDNDFYAVKIKLVTLVCLCLRRLDMIMALLIACNAVGALMIWVGRLERGDGDW